MTSVTVYTGITDELFDYCMGYNNPFNWLVTIISSVGNKFRVGKSRDGKTISMGAKFSLEKYLQFLDS